MAVIKSGATSDQLTIDATSKAARCSEYASDGVYMGRKPTYRAATIAVLVAAASAAPFLIIEGSATKKVTIQRVILSGFTLTAVAYATIEARKYSTAASGGTSTNLTQVNCDSNDAAPTLNAIRVYTAAPTAGTLDGNVDARRTLMQATTAAAAGIPDDRMDFDFRNQGEAGGIVLRGTSQALGFGFLAAPGSATSMSVSVEWTEE